MSGLLLICTELTLFCTELPENCFYLNQSELSNLFIYTIKSRTELFSTFYRNSFTKLVLTHLSCRCTKIPLLVITTTDQRLQWFLIGVSPLVRFKINSEVIDTRKFHSCMPEYASYYMMVSYHRISINVVSSYEEVEVRLDLFFCLCKWEA